MSGFGVLTEEDEAMEYEEADGEPTGDHHDLEASWSVDYLDAVEMAEAQYEPVHHYDDFAGGGFCRASSLISESIAGGVGCATGFMGGHYFERDGAAVCGPVMGVGWNRQVAPDGS